MPPTPRAAIAVRAAQAAKGCATERPRTARRRCQASRCAAPLRSPLRSPPQRCASQRAAHLKRFSGASRVSFGRRWDAVGALLARGWARPRYGFARAMLGSRLSTLLAPVWCEARPRFENTTKGDSSSELGGPVPNASGRRAAKRQSLFPPQVQRHCRERRKTQGPRFSAPCAGRPQSLLFGTRTPFSARSSPMSLAARHSAMSTTGW